MNELNSSHCRRAEEILRYLVRSYLLEVEHNTEFVWEMRKMLREPLGVQALLNDFKMYWEGSFDEEHWNIPILEKFPKKKGG